MCLIIVKRGLAGLRPFGLALGRTQAGSFWRNLQVAWWISDDDVERGGEPLVWVQLRVALIMLIEKLD